MRFRAGVAIDRGTVNTLVYVAGRGLVVDEPSAIGVALPRVVRHSAELDCRPRQRAREPNVEASRAVAVDEARKTPNLLVGVKRFALFLQFPCRSA